MQHYKVVVADVIACITVAITKNLISITDQNEPPENQRFSGVLNNTIAAAA